LELVLADATRVPLLDQVTIGRAAGSTVVLTDPSVSRSHARIRPGGRGVVMLEDAGSSHGTFLDGERVTGPVPLQDGATIGLGDSVLAVERRLDAAEAGRTIVVPAGATVTEPTALRPKVRSGYALKRLEAAEGDRRWVLRDFESGKFLRLGDDDAQLFERLDGSRSLADLVGEAEQMLGPAGPARLARLLADLGERGLIAGMDGASAETAEASPSWPRRLLRPRVRTFDGVAERFDALYRRGGWVLLTRPALLVLAVLAAAGVAVFACLVAGRYGTPFVVASKLGIGGLVFLFGRIAVVVAHEVAHGLIMASYGRRIERAGMKLLLIFPYAFVDTSEAWFEPRRRRIAISAAGPASDLTLGALFSVCCLLLGPGTVRDIFFQLAFAAYVGACFNLNPFLDRDGYHILVDVLREPGLRRRAREQFARRLSGLRRVDDSPVLARYSLYGAAWSVLAAFFAIAMTLRFRPALEAVAPGDWIVWAIMASVWIAVFVPVLAVIAGPLRQRRGRR
jgi:putative peptide zinc metalloprotease protein